MAHVQEGRPDHRSRAQQARQRSEEAVRQGQEHPRTGRSTSRPLVRLRAPGTVGVRSEAPRPRWRDAGEDQGEVALDATGSSAATDPVVAAPDAYPEDREFAVPPEAGFEVGFDASGPGNDRSRRSPSTARTSSTRSRRTPGTGWPAWRRPCPPRSASSSCGGPAARSPPAWTGRCSPPRASRVPPVCSRWPRAPPARPRTRSPRGNGPSTGRRVPAVVSVAAVQGHAIGAGFQLALGADIRIVAEDAQFTMAEPTLGLVPDLGGTKRLVDLVGYSRAAEICLTGRRVGAEEALRHRPGVRRRARRRSGRRRWHGRSPRLLAVDRDAAAETKALLLAAARAHSRAGGRRARRPSTVGCAPLIGCARRRFPARAGSANSSGAGRSVATRGGSTCRCIPCRRSRSMHRRQLGGRTTDAAGHLAAGVRASPGPYRRELLVFLVIVDRRRADRRRHARAGRPGRQPDHPRTARCAWSSRSRSSSPALAVVDAVLSFAQRWYSARIGEGLIFDMRTAVFDHVQRMPLAFFTRTQTGALVSRLNNDVLGAQQAFTSTLSGLVSNVVSLVLTAGRDVLAVLADHRAVAGDAAGVRHPGPAHRRATAGHHPRVLQPQRVDERDDDRALQRRRRAAGEAVRPTRRRGRVVPRAGRRGCATSASPRRCTGARSSSR